MRVLGIDLGSRYSGYGIVEQEKGDLRCLGLGEVKLKSTRPLSQRLLDFYKAMAEVIELHTPQQVVIEDLYVACNVKTAFVLGHFKGVAMLLAAKSGLQVFCYPPGEIKKAVVGYGQASKDQVRFMVQRLLWLKDLPSEHAADALAAAICHLGRIRQ